MDENKSVCLIWSIWRVYLQVPKCHFPNYIGRPKYTQVMAGALEGDLFVGPKGPNRCLLSIKYPMEHSIVTDCKIRALDMINNYLSHTPTISNVLVLSITVIKALENVSKEKLHAFQNHRVNEILRKLKALQ